MKPIIGILAVVDDEKTTSCAQSYVDVIEKSGGIPLLLPFVNNEETVCAFVELCDGFMFTGGKDVAPKRYGEETSDGCGIIQEHRDFLEFAVFSKAVKTQKPILGICRGMQVINVGLGGTLYQDIANAFCTSILHKQTEPKSEPSHSVRVEKDTPLYALTGKEIIPANSFHHQAVKTLGKGLKAMAWADDGVMEAAYLDGARYIRIYQWHPERLYYIDENQRKIFTDFISACQK